MLSFLAQKTALPIYIVTLVILSPLRPFPACNVLQSLNQFSCWLSNLLLLLEVLFLALFRRDATSQTPTARSPATAAHNLEGSCRLWSSETGLTAGQKLPCLRIKSMLCFNYLLSGENITLADKKQSYNVSQLNDCGYSTL